MLHDGYNKFSVFLRHGGHKRCECLYPLLISFLFYKKPTKVCPTLSSVIMHTVLTIAHFTVTGANKAGVDFGLIRPFLLYYVNHVVVMLTIISSAKFPYEKGRGLHRNKVNLSLTFTQRLGYYAHNSKMVHYPIPLAMRIVLH